MSSRSIFSRLLALVLSPAQGRRKPGPARTQSPRVPVTGSGAEPGQHASSQTRRIDLRQVREVPISYAPDRDGDPDAGEVIWTWVPYDENDGRGKDRPVLVIGHESESRVYAVRMTSKQREGDRDLIALGSGPWDSQGRPSWVDIDAVYSVHVRGMRREAAILDRERFARVAEALSARYGWSRSL